MTDTPSITIVKTFTYRGQAEEWSNTYHFTGTTPSDFAAWKTLADAIIAAEKVCYTSSTRAVRAYGYVAGNEHSVATIDYVAMGITNPNGTAVAGSAGTLPGDSAAVLRALRDGKNAKGRNTYCFKYFHSVPASGSDTVDTTYKTAVTAFGAKLLDGTLPGGFKWCAPQGQSLSVPSVKPHVTTRTLKRRGKRPSS